MSVIQLSAIRNSHDYAVQLKWLSRHHYNQTNDNKKVKIKTIKRRMK